jgi:D-amino peptidase
MKVYILVDMEGGSGVYSFRLQTWSGTPYNETAKRLVTGDTNASIEGAFEGGADEVVVFDSHGSGTIDFEQLDPRAKLLSLGTRVPYGMDATFGALFQVAQHAMAGTAGAVLCHSYDSREIISIRLNGREIGEMGIRAAIAGAFGIPFVLETGDAAACREAEALVPGMETACVKWGSSQEAALMLHPQKSRELIREKAASAVRRAPAISPVRLGPPYELAVSYLQEQRAHGVSLLPGAERLDARTVRMRGDDLCALETSLLSW